MKNFIHFVYNTKSGQQHSDDIINILRQSCADHAFKLSLYPIKSKKDFNQVVDKAIGKVSENSEDILMVAGGDGTIRGVAQKLINYPQVKLSLIPSGTFNFFCREHNIPEDLDKALALAFNQHKLKKVSLGQINTQIFLINASIGLYALSIQERERSTQRFGRYRLVVILSTLLSLIRHSINFKFLIKQENESHITSTSMLFIGNNALQLQDFSPTLYDCVNHNELALVTMKNLSPWATLWVIFKSRFTWIEDQNQLDTFCAPEFDIAGTQKRYTVALDGEMFKLTQPFKIKKVEAALTLIVPKESIT